MTDEEDEGKVIRLAFSRKDKDDDENLKTGESVKKVIGRAAVMLTEFKIDTLLIVGRLHNGSIMFLMSDPLDEIQALGLADCLREMVWNRLRKKAEGGGNE